MGDEWWTHEANSGMLFNLSIFICFRVCETCGTGGFWCILMSELLTLACSCQVANCKLTLASCKLLLTLASFILSAVNVKTSVIHKVQVSFCVAYLWFVRTGKVSVVSMSCYRQEVCKPWCKHVCFCLWVTTVNNCGDVNVALTYALYLPFNFTLSSPLYITFCIYCV